jgi:RNA polymerase sigma-70 factor (ECF subfamily)
MWPETNSSAQNNTVTQFMFNTPEADQRLDPSSPEVLIQRLRGGDCQLFYDLTKGFLPNVYAFVRSMVSDTSSADDICQQTFLIALQKVHQLRELRCLKSWVMQIAVNQVRMMWRVSRWHPKVCIDDFRGCDKRQLAPDDLIDTSETALEAVTRRELRDFLEYALQQLTPRYRSVFWLRDVEQFSGAEAAAILGITSNCAKARLSRARLKLRDYLSPILTSEAATSRLLRQEGNRRKKYSSRLPQRRQVRT